MLSIHPQRTPEESKESEQKLDEYSPKLLQLVEALSLDQPEILRPTLVEILILDIRAQLIAQRIERKFHQGGRTRLSDMIENHEHSNMKHRVGVLTDTVAKLISIKSVSKEQHGGLTSTSTKKINIGENGEGMITLRRREREGLFKKVTNMATVRASYIDLERPWGKNSGRLILEVPGEHGDELRDTCLNDLEEITPLEEILIFRDQLIQAANRNKDKKHQSSDIFQIPSIATAT